MEHKKRHPSNEGCRVLGVPYENASRDLGAIFNTLSY